MGVGFAGALAYSPAHLFRGCWRPITGPGVLRGVLSSFSPAGPSQMTVAEASPHVELRCATCNRLRGSGKLTPSPEEKSHLAEFGCTQLVLGRTSAPPAPLDPAACRLGTSKLDTAASTGAVGTDVSPDVRFDESCSAAIRAAYQQQRLRSNLRSTNTPWASLPEALLRERRARQLQEVKANSCKRPAHPTRREAVHHGLRGVYTLRSHKIPTLTPSLPPMWPSPMPPVLLPHPEFNFGPLAQIADA